MFPWGAVVMDLDLDLGMGTDLLRRIGFGCWERRRGFEDMRDRDICVGIVAALLRIK